VTGIGGWVSFSRPRESGEEEEADMEMGQGFIDTTKELNVDRGTLPCEEGFH
jgi:hypothetical protein